MSPPIPPARLKVFTQFAPSGAGAFSRSAVAQVQAAQLHGVKVQFFAGGPLSVVQPVRLAMRSRAAAACAIAAVFFLSHGGPSGSLKAAAFAASQGSQVFVFRCGFSGPVANLATTAGGRWVPVHFAGAPCLQWVLKK